MAGSSRTFDIVAAKCRLREDLGRASEEDCIARGLIFDGVKGEREAGMKKNSTVLLNQIRSVDKKRLVKRL